MMDRFSSRLLGRFRDSLHFRDCLGRLEGGRFEEGPLSVSDLVGNSDAERLGAVLKVVLDPLRAGSHCPSQLGAIAISAMSRAARRHRSGVAGSRSGSWRFRPLPHAAAMG
ncbi:MAG: hypothetical protein ACREEZ_13960 [Stellaceae bacterium]